MYTPIVVHKGRTNIIILNMDEDISSDTFTSEIRVAEDVESTLLATWSIIFVTDGTDGKLQLTLFVADTEEIEYVNGFMDVKRVSGGLPFAVFDAPVPVVFREFVTQ